MGPLTRRTCGEDDGFTLVELLVAMIILSVFFGVFSSLVARFFDLTGRQQSRSASVDVSRNMIMVLDRQVRYANAVNTPVTTADGTRWIEWRSGSTGKQQTCFQWRVRPGGAAQFRTWLPPLSGSGASTPTVWRTQGTGVQAIGTEPVFAVNAALASSSALNRQVVTIAFRTTSGTVRDGSPTRVALTALNSTSASAPTTPVCQEVPRS
jgi:prepilin-type N-terminal cleavage/methylation domain-containing protein